MGGGEQNIENLDILQSLNNYCVFINVSLTNYEVLVDKYCSYQQGFLKYKTI